MARTWILTGSPENYEATKDHDFTVIGLKERNRARALGIEPGDRIVLYLTRVMAFAASIRVEGEMYEDRAKIWPGKPGKADIYPWRFHTSPEIVLDAPLWVPAQSLVGRLEHIAKWPERALDARLSGADPFGVRPRRGDPHRATQRRCAARRR